jgi:hypothetical protein
VKVLARPCRAFGGFPCDLGRLSGIIPGVGVERGRSGLYRATGGILGGGLAYDVLDQARQRGENGLARFDSDTLIESAGLDVQE